MSDSPAAGGTNKDTVTPPGRLGPEFVREGDVLAGNFIIESLIGQGGMAVVYRAMQKSLNRPVAVKILHSRFSRDREFLSRFEAEAGALASLQHPNIVNIIDRGHDGERYFFAMEHVEGETLDHLIIQNQLKPDDWRRVITACREGLDYVHRRGVVHRDIKPSNILVGELIKIGDFGIAHIVTGDLTGTTKGQAVRALGTANYMAPEQIENPLKVDHRADIYSLGVTFYKMFARTLPVGDFPLPSEANTDVPVNVDDVILKAMAKDPALRYQTIAQFCDDLLKALKVQSTSIAAVMSYRKGPVKGGALYTGADFRSSSVSSPTSSEKTPKPKPKPDEKSKAKRGEGEAEPESYSKSGVLRRMTPLPVEDAKSTPKPAKTVEPKPPARRDIESKSRTTPVPAAVKEPEKKDPPSAQKMIAIAATVVALALIGIVVFALVSSGSGTSSSSPSSSDGGTITEQREKILEELIREKNPDPGATQQVEPAPAPQAAAPSPSPFAREQNQETAPQPEEL